MPRVALLTNFVAPYRVPLFEALRNRVGQLRVFASTSVEPNRTWKSYRGELDVTIQRTITLRKRWRDAAGFTDVGYVHFPYDTLAQLRRFRPDAIISSELGLRTALAAFYKRRYGNVRLVVWATVSEHTENDRGFLRSLIRPRLLQYADAVLVNGASGARYVTKLGVPRERVTLAPYTTDVAAFQTAQRVADASPVIRLLFAGMFVERKGLLPFLTVLRRWADTHLECVQFAIAGDGPLRPQLEAFDAGPHLAVRILGPVDYQRLPDLYAGADIFVLPTLADEWGVVVNEAMAAGLPVLGSRHSQAVEELVTDDETGWMFTPEDDNTIFNALDRALRTSADMRQHMGNRARQRVLELTPDRVADRIATALCLSPQSS